MKMDRMGLRAVIILPVVLSSFFRPSSLEYYVDSDSNCLKENISFGIQYRCPKKNEQIRLLISSTNEVTLDCVNGISFDREILPKLNLTEYISFELIDCLLTVSFDEILSKFNMNNVKYFTFYPPLVIASEIRTTNVTKKMFEHMESMEYLTLEFGQLNLSMDFLENTPNLRKLTLRSNGLRQISKYFNHVSKLESLDLSTNQINFIPDGVFENLENLVELKAPDNKLTNITKNSFKGLKGLKVLWLYFNNITNIEEESFADMHKLVNISFYGNNIQETHRHLFKNNELLENIKLDLNSISVLPDYLFANLTSLQTIGLSYNNLREIPEHTFSNCGKLRDLTLKKNRLSTIPEKTFRNLTSLEKIRLDRNQILVLSDYLFANLTSLQTINLSFNNLREIPEHTFTNCGKLRDLTLKQNRLSTIPEKTFRNLTSLEKIWLDRNQILVLPDYLFANLTSLQTINLSFNNLREIPEHTFTNCGKLRDLILMYNHLSTIPEKTFRNLTSLEKIWLDGNQILVLPDYLFANLTSLQTIDLDFNNLREISEHTFTNCGKLRDLTFKQNRLSTIPEKTFRNLTSLEKIRLDSNQILVLPDYLFANLTSLQTIDLSFNNLREIPEHTFSNCGKLRDLTLKKNRLSTIPEITFFNLKSLQKLDLSNNLLETLSDQLFSSLNNLEELLLSDNQMTTLDSDIFHKMGKLKILNLRRNNISFIHLLAFRGLEDSLIHLDLSYNQLNSTYDIDYMSPFKNFRSLEELILGKNKIREYPAMLALSKLKIDLSSNLIKKLKVHDLWQQRNLTSEVDLTHNEIQYVDFSLAEFWFRYDSYDTIYNLHIIIYLDDNPIVCDCSNKDLIRYNNDEMAVLKTKFDIKQDELTCSEDKNILVTDLKPIQICPDIEGCPSPCTCTYKFYKRAVIVDCSFKNVSSYPEFSINGPEYEQTILNLRGNHLNAGPVENSNYTNVTYLDLSQNHISEMSWIPPNIMELNLKENRLHKLDSHFVNSLKNTTSLVRIYLGNNSWDCNCDASDLQKFLFEYPDKVDSSNVYCHNSTIKIVTLTDLCKTSALLTVLLSIVFTILLCFTVALALYYRYQKEIKIYLYAQNLCLWFVTEEELDKDKTYDVFISYANQDENFVIDYLLPELEYGQTPFKVCVHTRDWVPGELIITQIINSVKDSRRTLVVLSNNFVDSMWGKLEFRTAHTEAISEGRARVVVVIYGELNEDKLDDELKSYIKTNTYVKWGDKYFWNKLKYALPHYRQQVKMVVKTDEELDLIPTPPSPTTTSTSLVTLNASLFHANLLNINIPKVEEEDQL